MIKKFELGKLKIKIFVDESNNETMIKLDSNGYGDRIELSKSQFANIFKHYNVLLNEMNKIDAKLIEINNLKEIEENKESDEDEN